MTLFDILPLHCDALSVSINMLLHLFWKRSFSIAHVCTGLLVWVSNAQKRYVPQAVMHYGLCKFIIDAHDCCHLCERYSSVFTDQGIHPLDVRVVHRGPGRLSPTPPRYTCSVRFKAFLFTPRIHLVNSWCVLYITKSHGVRYPHVWIRFHRKRHSIVPRWCNRWVERPYVWPRYSLPLDRTMRVVAHQRLPVVFPE